MAELLHQLVHGDVGPDNVLRDGNDIVAVIDFAPFREPVLFGVCGALYWYHLYAHPDGPDHEGIRASLSA